MSSMCDIPATFALLLIPLSHAFCQSPAFAYMMRPPELRAMLKQMLFLFSLHLPLFGKTILWRWAMWCLLARTLDMIK